MSRKKFQKIATILGLGKRLREIRGEESQDSFGRRNLGLGKSTISKFETDIMIPDSETLGKYAALGKTTKEWLLRGDQPQVRESTADFKRPQAGVPGLDSPYLFAAVDKPILADIIEKVEMGLRRKKKSLSPARYAHLVSLLYDRYQETGQPVSRSTIEDFLRLV